MSSSTGHISLLFLVFTAVVLFSSVPLTTAVSGASGSVDGPPNDEDSVVLVQVSCVQLDQPDNNNMTSSMPRRLQLNVTVDSDYKHVVTLLLQRNDNIPNNVTVVVGVNGRLVTSPTKDVTIGSLAYYFDVEHEASIVVKQLPVGSRDTVDSYSGSFKLNGSLYVIEPLDITWTRRRRRRKRQSTSNDNETYVVYPAQTVQQINYTSALSLPAEAILQQTMARADDPINSNTLTTKLNYVSEIIVAIDYRLYARFYNLTNNTKSATSRKLDTLTNINFYVSHIINGVDMRYRSINDSRYSINVRLVGFYVATTATDSEFVESYRVGDSSAAAYVYAPQSLSSFVDWINSHKSLFPSFDQVTLITSEYMNGQTGNRISGLAYFCGICTPYAAVIVREAGLYGTTQTIAHELGHNFGATHDGVDNTCSASDLHIMVASPGQLTDINYMNAFTFSQCSINEIRNFLNLLSGSNCLLTTNSTQQTVPHVQPGQLFGLDVQCQIILGAGAFYCGGQTNDAQICRTMQCFHPQFLYCYATYEQRAFSGTTCGDKKWCQFGDCIADTSAPPAQELCIYGDTKVQLTTGLYCSNITKSTAWQCYDDTNADFCCHTCSDLYNSTQTDCEYGDKAPLCQNIQLVNCSDQYVNKTCCKSCSQIKPFTTDCPIGDRRTDCASLIDSSIKCYTYANDCCATCAKYKTNISGCTYGDKDVMCVTLTQSQECYSKNQSCCQTCNNLRSTNIGCEWGDKVAGWCNNILPEQCYGNDVTCCQTCNQYFNKTGLSGCEYGDRDRKWCQNTIIYLHQCYSYSSYCCGTCSYYRTGPTGCEWGDKDLSCPQRNCADPSSWNTCCRSCARYITTRQTVLSTTSMRQQTTSFAPATLQFLTNSSLSLSSVRPTVPTTATATLATTQPKTTTTLPPSTTTTTTTSHPQPTTTTTTQTATTTTATQKPTTTTTQPTTTTATATTTSLQPQSTTTTTQPTTTLPQQIITTSTTTTSTQEKPTTTTPQPTTIITTNTITQPSATNATTTTTAITQTSVIIKALTTLKTTAKVSTPPTSTLPFAQPSTTTVAASQAENTTTTAAVLPTTIPAENAKAANTTIASSSSVTTVTESRSSQSWLTACVDNARWCQFIPASDCYNASATCCFTCSKFRVSASGCEYGDHYWWCAQGNYCYNDFLRSSCCITCGTVGSMSETTESTCQDLSTSCSSVDPASCYNTATRVNCCQTCSKFKTGPAGCEYGDRELWCSTINPSECSFNEADCCRTCSKSIR